MRNNLAILILASSLLIYTGFSAMAHEDVLPPDSPVFQKKKGKGLPLRLMLREDYGMGVAEDLKDAIFEWNSLMREQVVTMDRVESQLVNVEVVPARKDGLNGNIIVGQSFREEHGKPWRMLITQGLPSDVRVTVMLHEIGHLLGIRDHLADPESVMYYKCDRHKDLTETDLAAARLAVEAMRRETER